MFTWSCCVFWTVKSCKSSLQPSELSCKTFMDAGRRHCWVRNKRLHHSGYGRQLCVWISCSYLARPMVGRLYAFACQGWVTFLRSAMLLSFWLGGELCSMEEKQQLLCNLYTMFLMHWCGWHQSCTELLETQMVSTEEYLVFCVCMCVCVTPIQFGH